MERTDKRVRGALRPVEIVPNYTEMASGSALVICGRTRVLCTASAEPGVPGFLRGTGRGWVTAEYAMLPGATPVRKPRDGVRKDGRSVEIQRLIGRSLRACCDLTRLGAYTITLDCDVLQADGGTRTASITGAFAALCLAVKHLLDEGKILDSPITKQIAAVSVGMIDQETLLDLCYAEDSRADVDMNVAMTRDAQGKMAYVEVQGTAEGATFDRQQMDEMLDLAQSGIEQLMDAQRAAIGAAASVIGRKPRLVLASGNAGKLKEMRALLYDRFDVTSMKELGVTADIDENGATFAENALIKANEIMRLTGCASLADDSGLAVDALDGRPGVHSARYAGVHGDDEANNRLLLKELDGVRNRSARYVCAMALARPGRDPIVAEGACAGEILTAYRGTGGFGYDPLFFAADLGETFAESSPERKNAVSHRARAIAALLAMLDHERG